MTKVIRVCINPWDDDQPQDYLLKLEDIKYFCVTDYEQYEDKEDWFYAIHIYLEEKIREELNGHYVMEEFKTKGLRDYRFLEINMLINGETDRFRPVSEKRLDS